MLLAGELRAAGIKFKQSKKDSNWLPQAEFGAQAVLV